MLEMNVIVKKAFGLIDNRGRFFIPGEGVFSKLLQNQVPDCNVYIRYKDKRVNAKVSMQVCTLGIQDGDKIVLEIEGEEAYGDLSTVLKICKSCEVIE